MRTKRRKTTRSLFFEFSEKIMLRLKVYLLRLPLERSDYLVERSDQRMERGGHGTKWP